MRRPSAAIVEDFELISKLWKWWCSPYTAMAKSVMKRAAEHFSTEDNSVTLSSSYWHNFWRPFRFWFQTFPKLISRSNWAVVPIRIWHSNCHNFEISSKSSTIASEGLRNPDNLCFLFYIVHIIFENEMIIGARSSSSFYCAYKSQFNLWLQFMAH